MVRLAHHYYPERSRRIMSKAGKYIFLAMVFLAIAGTLNTTFAQTLTPSILEGLDKLNVNSLNQNSCVTSLISSSASKVCISVVEISPPLAWPKVQVTQAKSVSGHASDSTILDPNKIFYLVNRFRISAGLAPFEKNDQVCELAQTRSTELAAEILNGTLHLGLYNRNLPYWIWENAKYGSDEQGIVAWWLASPLHHLSIVGDYKYSCIKCVGMYCSELFTSFAPKI